MARSSKPRAKATAVKTTAAPKGGKKTPIKPTAIGVRSGLSRAAKSKAQETIDSYLEDDSAKEESEEDINSEDEFDDGSSDNPTKEMKVSVKSDLPGFDVWDTKTKLASGRAINEMSQYDISTANFKHTVHILHNEIFTLKPLIINEGPMKGRRVLMLEPTTITDYFAFMDLPPELRKMIYDILFLEKHSGKIDVRTYKPVGQPRRAVRPGFRDAVTHKGLSWDKTFGKWTDQVPSEFSLLRVNKQIFREAVAVAYGANTVRFNDIKWAAIFLKGIGSMRQHLGSVYFGEESTGTVRNTYEVFKYLKTATSLRTLTIAHRIACQKMPYYGSWGSWAGIHRISLADLVDIAQPMLDAIKKTRNDREEEIDVSKLLVLEPPSMLPCIACKDDPSGNRCIKVTCKPTCKDAAAHHEELATKLKKLLTKDSGVKP